LLKFGYDRYKTTTIFIDGQKDRVMGFTPVTLFFYMSTIQLVYNHPLKSLFKNYRNIFIILTKNRITKRIAFI
jgi:hypothetical protein